MTQRLLHVGSMRLLRAARLSVTTPAIWPFSNPAFFAVPFSINFSLRFVHQMSTSHTPNESQKPALRHGTVAEHVNQKPFKWQAIWLASYQNGFLFERFSVYMFYYCSML